MSAICGVWNLDGRPGAAADCERMQRALAIYGRNWDGRWESGGLAMGVQLAALLPEDVHDRQPLVGDEGRFTLVADVRLDNRPELAVELGLPPERAERMADADFVLAAWERWQEACLDRLYGDFAVAVWDASQRRLYLARDPLGQRPLFYHRAPGRVAFATMAKGLHALPDAPRAPDLVALREYLAIAPQRGPRSLFAGIERVEPGGLVTLGEDGQHTCAAWYQWPLRGKARALDDQACIEGLRAIFDRAVSDRLRTTGAIASQLSGGLDSSLVTATAARLLAERGEGLTAYTHVPLRNAPLEERADRVLDEWPLAATVARRFANIEHVAVEARDRLLADDLDSHLFAFEHPPLNLCNNLWLNEIARQAAARGKKVLLIGSMGNATVSQAGMERLPELLLSGRLATWLREAAAVARVSGKSMARLAFYSVSPMLPPRLVRFLQSVRGRRSHRVGAISALRREALADKAFRRRLRTLNRNEDEQPEKSPRGRSASMLRRMDVLGLTAKGYLAAFGVERRDPTADRRLWEFALSLPSSVFLRDGQTKWLYRAAFADRVGPEILQESRKGYQAADWPERLRRSRTLLDEQLRDAGRSRDVAELIDVEGLIGLLGGALPAGRISATQVATYRLKLLRGLSVARFVGKLDTRNSPPH